MKKLIKQVSKLFEPLRYPLIAIAIGLFVGGLIIAVSGHNPFEAIWGLIRGGFLTSYAITSTLNRATPIIIVGLSASLAWGSGYSSMGGQGQMILGSLTAAMVAAYCPGPKILVIILALLSAIVVGMLYSLLSAFISNKFEAPLLIITLMFNYIADYIASYLTTYNFRDPDAADRLAVQTKRIATAILPRIFPKYTLHVGFIIAIIAVIVVAFILKKTSFGYKSKMTGYNANFARYGGINANKTMYSVLLLSGALAGLAGAVEALGSRFRYIDKMITSPGYAWSGITASLMSSNNPFGVLISSIFLAGLTTGGSSIELSLNIPSEITSVIQGILTMLVTAKFIIQLKKKKDIQKEGEQA